MKLLNKTPLTIYRQDTPSGYLNDNGRWVEDNLFNEIPIRCSLQPYRKGDNQITLPEGTRSEDAYFIFTKSEILSADEQENRLADETEIKGRRFECYHVADWTWYGLSTDHYKALFIKKDKK